MNYETTLLEQWPPDHLLEPNWEEAWQRKQSKPTTIQQLTQVFVVDGNPFMHHSSHQLKAPWCVADWNLALLVPW